MSLAVLIAIFCDLRSDKRHGGSDHDEAKDRVQQLCSVSYCKQYRKDAEAENERA